MKPLSRYPRPQFKRDSYICLNGEWDYKISKNATYPASFDGKILVPYSPETELSGVNHVLQPDEFLFYKLVFELPKDFVKERVYLHFLGVDQICDVYLNGHELGHHVGGYLPFSFEIKTYLEEKKNVLILRVQDLSDTSYHSKGKQRLEHGGIWYTPQSGIWLPVFLESTPFLHVNDVKFTPNIDKEEIIINVSSGADACYITLEENRQMILCNEDVHIKLNNMHLWSIEDPYLYPITIEVGEDKVESYFAMRKYSIIKDECNIPRLALNNKPIFMNGVLDQGYYKNGLLTPESYDDYVKDIELVKALGFNTIRKHIKIEVPIWYYECDKRGIIVWQDFVNGGEQYDFLTIIAPLFTHMHGKDHNYKKFKRLNEQGRKDAIKEFKQTINYLYNSPCIALWTIFNEGWGQFDAKEVLPEMEKLDKTRLFDHASGWYDQKIGDFKSLHVYFQKVRLPHFEKRCKIVSEYGGLVLPIEGHIVEGDPVYKKFDTKEEYLAAFEKMINRDVISNISKGLSAAIYTQLSDVEEEMNGFVTFDREVVKIEPDTIRKINEKVHL